MTPEERALRIVPKNVVLCPEDDVSLRWDIERAIVAAVGEAVAAEREACARLVENYPDATWNVPSPSYTHGESLARAIRARKGDAAEDRAGERVM